MKAILKVTLMPVRATGTSQSTCITLHAAAGTHSAAGFVMSSDSRFVMSDRSSAAADTSGCAAASS